MKYKFTVETVYSAQVEIEAESIQQALELVAEDPNIEWVDTGLIVLDYDSLLTNTINIPEPDIEFLKTLYNN